VTDDQRHAGEVLNKVLGFVERNAGDLVVADVATEFMSL
jgi:hypothetical protein